MLSHEIRTPLTSIRESVSLIKEEVMGPVNDRQKRFLDIASAEIERITNLLTTLMRVSSLGANPLQVEPGPISSAALVAGSVQRLLPLAEARGIALRAETGEPAEDAMGDMTHLQQVLLNLVGNAIKFSPPGSEVVVGVEREGERELRICVTDNGPGIPPEEQAHVFHRYFRGSKIRDQVDGIGLGLSISKHIIEAHGGRLWVVSEPGRGSSFCFTLKPVPGYGANHE
jgi:signal transduction histidine kinase